MKENSNEFLTVSQLCEEMQISRHIAYKLVNTTGFPVIKIGETYRIPRNGLNEWIKNNTGGQVCLDE